MDPTGITRIICISLYLHIEYDKQSCDMKENGRDPSISSARPNRRVPGLQNKGQVFLDLLEHPIFDEFALDFLGDWYLMSDYQANIAGPGGRPMPLHYDQIVSQPLTPFPLGLNIVFCLDDFTDANGATRVVPGSHLLDSEKVPENPFKGSVTIAAEAPAGRRSCGTLDCGMGPVRT